MQIDEQTLLRKTKILFVEDNLIIRKEIKRFIESRVDTFYIAENGAIGLEMYNKYKPDIVISDIEMPLKDGLQLAKEIKETNANAPVILMTAFDDKEYLLKALVIGVDDYILKPVNYEILERSIKKRACQVYQQQEILRLNKLLSEKIEILNEKTVYLDNILLYSTDMAIIATDLEFFVKYFNPMAERILGFKSDEIIGKKFTELFSQENSEYTKLAEIAEEVRQKGQSINILEICKDQNIQLVETRVSQIHDKESHLVGFVFMLRDVTDQRKMEDELNRMQRLESVGILAGGLAHDFNNLLTTILGNIGLTKLSIHPEDDSYRNLTEAEKACSQARNLTSRFLTFSRGGTPFFKTLSIADFLPDYFNLALSGTNVNCDYLLPDDLWVVNIDEGQISQVIQNIVANSIEAMPTAGKITVRAENRKIKANELVGLDEGNYVKISIEDKGKGIQKEHLPHIFDPYFSTKEKGSQKGMGLGLSICYSIIKKHNGYITAKSQYGNGTTLFIYLPASPPEIEAEIEETVPSKKRKVLLMDDDLMVSDVVERMLSHLGYDPVTTKNGEETLEIYSQAKEINEPFDIVILDLTIKGGMGGEETMKNLLEIDPKVRAIVSSGYSNDPILANYHAYGFTGIVKKPYKIKELAAKIEAVINNSN